MRELLLAGLVLLLPAAAVAQDDCFPAEDSNEARTFAIVSVPLAFSGSGTVVAPSRGVVVGVEGALLPHVPDALATPTACRPGKGPENANPLPGFVRLRVAALLAGWSVEAGWIPPVRVEGVRANLLGLAVGRDLPLGSRWRASPRLHALLGSLRAPITCDAEAIDDPDSECFAGTRSNDRWRPGAFGAEVSVRRGDGAWVPHAGVGYTHLRPRFQVDFTNALGVTDNRRVSVNLHRMALFGGVTLATGPWAVSLEAYGTIGDRVTGRTVIRRALGG